MKLKLLLGMRRSATLISAYTLATTKPDDVKEMFCEELGALVSSVPQSDKLILLGHFHAHVSKDHQSWEGSIGHHGVGKCNGKGLLILRTCATHGLAITNSMLSLPTLKRTSWMHPRSKHWHLIDYVIVRARDQ